MGQQVQAEVDLIRREQIEEALHRIAHLFTVQRGEHQMAGFRSLERRERRVEVTNFADKNHVRGLTHGTAQTTAEGIGVATYFALGEQTLVIVEDVFDGVLNGDDVPPERLVQPLQECGQRGRFTGACGPGDQDNAIRLGHPLGQQMIGGAEGLELRNLGADAAHHRA